LESVEAATAGEACTAAAVTGVATDSIESTKTAAKDKQHPTHVRKPTDLVLPAKKTVCNGTKTCTHPKSSSLVTAGIFEIPYTESKLAETPIAESSTAARNTFLSLKRENGRGCEPPIPALRAHASMSVYAVII
jgi:hypothetical protein